MAAPASNKKQLRNNISISMGLATIVAFFALSGFITYWNIRTLNENALLVTSTHEMITSLDDLTSLMKDAETGQRGYILTGNNDYLKPYTTALSRIEEELNDIDNLSRNSPAQQARIPLIKLHINNKLKEMAETIELRRTKGFEAALALVITDRGKNEMEMIRSQAAEMERDEESLRTRRFGEMRDAYRTAIISGILSCLLGIALSVAVAYLIRRASAIRERQEWLQSGQVGLGKSMFGEQRAEQLGDNIVKFLAEYLDAHSAAFFIKGDGVFKRAATYGVASESMVPEKFGLNDGLLGQAVKDKRTFILNDVPEGYLAVGSALGQGAPRHLVISPSATDGEINAVLELGFIHPLNDLTVQFLEQASESIAIAIKSANYRLHLQNLLDETQRQSEELQSQSEELRVNNEELEEQSRALRESQARLEQQQAEMEQTNAQLEEQAQQLEAQRDDIAYAKNAVQIKAQELERASQYKSDFLANMSHELRTPLNSSLILAKLLSDNPAGNLTQEQVKFAKTIQTSGNDLLALINDILDLSKIEAGHMEVHTGMVSIERIANDIASIFEPVAKQKGLVFYTDITSNCPKFIETDRQRLEQILKNLLSNAIKFTEKGKVGLTVKRLDGNQIEFIVTDTGIGIPHEQQKAIFDAFRQADGTISRRYGGTGLGLSISRELARLLGGFISLKSKPGEGSSFIFTINETYDPDIAISAAGELRTESGIDNPIPAPTPRPKVSAPTFSRSKHIDDDREKLTGDKRIILIVEDDASFASILRDLAHELDFQCLVASTAEEALIIIKQYQPNAVVLDIGLPDNSGLYVLDRLKQNSQTRHIPVHVISANDYSETALSLGAAAYMLKPVQREELLDSFRQIETKLSQRMRRVLVVEDDLVQLESVRKLLGSQDVETIGVDTAAKCLELLRESVFDCMVLDLSLPDATGYSLLETLSREDAYSFPPVIVYTGHDLSPDEEQKLRRYSKSIIIKGVKSPERLLDEVTLFLHQVVAELPAEQQRMLEKVRNRDTVLEGRNILVVEDDVRNIYALSSIFEPCGAIVHIARNGREALSELEKYARTKSAIDLVLMDVMMPEMDGMTATREIRKNPDWKKLPVIMLTAKAMKNDQENCLAAGANDYMAKPLDVEKLLSLVRVWMPR